MEQQINLSSELDVRRAKIEQLESQGEIVYKEKFDWADGLSESATEIKRNVDELKKLQDLEAEIKSLELIINSPESSQEQIEQARTKLEEISAYLNQEYNLKINADTESLGKAVDILSQGKRDKIIENKGGALPRLQKNGI